MEKADHELLMQIVPTNPRLKELYDEHIKLAKEVEKFERYAAYSSSVALKQKELKKAKLKGMDEIQEILNHYRSEEDGTQVAA